MLKFVGCGAALYPELYNNNAWFVLDKDLFLIDCGETSFRQHYIHHHFDGAKSVTVFVTHMHSDHIGSLGSLIVYLYVKLGIRPSVIFPEPDKLKEVFDLTGVDPAHYQLYADYSAAGDPRIKENHILVHHDAMIHSYGYFLDIQGSEIYYSGDAAEIPDEVINKLINGELDEVYQDTASEDHGAHLTLDKLESSIPYEYRDKVYCMHYDGEYTDKIRDLGFHSIKGEQN